MGQPTQGKGGRRDANWWAPLNNAYRAHIEEHGSKPDRTWLESWFESNGKATWPDGNEPSIQAAWDHCKCLRTLGQARDYFRQYRARKKDLKEAIRDEEGVYPRQQGQGSGHLSRQDSGPGDGPSRSRKRSSYEPVPERGGGSRGGALADGSRRLSVPTDVRRRGCHEEEDDDTLSEEDERPYQRYKGDHRQHRRHRSHSRGRQSAHRRSVSSDSWPSDEDGSYQGGRNGGAAVGADGRRSDDEDDGSGGRKDRDNNRREDRDGGAPSRRRRHGSGHGRTPRTGRRGHRSDDLYNGRSSGPPSYGGADPSLFAGPSQGFFGLEDPFAGLQLPGSFPMPSLQWPQVGGLPPLMGVDGGIGLGGGPQSSVAASLAVQQQLLLMQLQSLQQQRMQLQTEELLGGMPAASPPPALPMGQLPDGLASSHSQAQLMALLQQGAGGGGCSGLPSWQIGAGGGMEHSGGLGLGLGGAGGQGFGAGSGSLGMGGLGLAPLMLQQHGLCLQQQQQQQQHGLPLQQQQLSHQQQQQGLSLQQQQQGGFGLPPGLLLQGGLQGLRYHPVVKHEGYTGGSGGNRDEDVTTCSGMQLCADAVAASAAVAPISAHLQQQQQQHWGGLPQTQPNLVLQSLIAAAACSKAAAMQQQQEMLQQEGGPGGSAAGAASAEMGSSSGRTADAEAAAAHQHQRRSGADSEGQRRQSWVRQGSLEPVSRAGTPLLAGRRSSSVPPVWGDAEASIALKQHARGMLLLQGGDALVEVQAKAGGVRKHQDSDRSLDALAAAAQAMGGGMFCS